MSGTQSQPRFSPSVAVVEVHSTDWEMALHAFRATGGWGWGGGGEWGAVQRVKVLSNKAASDTTYYVTQFVHKTTEEGEQKKEKEEEKEEEEKRKKKKVTGQLHQ